jgi:hypothetical protein
MFSLMGFPHLAMMMLFTSLPSFLLPFNDLNSLCVPFHSFGGAPCAWRFLCKSEKAAQYLGGSGGGQAVGQVRPETIQMARRGHGRWSLL